MMRWLILTALVTEACAEPAAPSERSSQIVLKPPPRSTIVHRTLTIQGIDTDFFSRTSALVQGLLEVRGYEVEFGDDGTFQSLASNGEPHLRVFGSWPNSRSVEVDRVSHAKFEIEGERALVEAATVVIREAAQNPVEVTEIRVGRLDRRAPERLWKRGERGPASIAYLPTGDVGIPVGGYINDPRIRDAPSR